MKSEFVMAINQICSERSLPQEVIIEAIESALVSAYKRNYTGGQNIKAEIDMLTGVPHVYLERIVTDPVEDDRFEISLKEARRTDPDVELGMFVRTDVTPDSFGRIAAQTAKQVILQRIREAERDALFSSYVDREGELINGMVANITAQAVTLNLGRTEAIMPRSQQVPRERYRIGQRVRAYVMEVRRTSRGPQIIVSRTHRNMLRRLLELEVPEIFNGAVEIKSIAREAGNRSKVAVAALQEGVDPVGSCVGVRGMRIQSIVGELGGEKIDVVQWSPDTATFIANALSPAKVNYALLSDDGADGKTATVVVPDDQLSLAIGKEGQNARLAAKLTGWRIDIKSQSEAQTEELTVQAQPTGASSKEKDILAMAEAILLGKQPPSSLRDLEAVKETSTGEPAAVEETTEEELAEKEVEAEALEPTTEELSVLATADALLREEEPALGAEEVSAVDREIQYLPAEETISEPEEVPEPALVAAEAAPEPVVLEEEEAEEEEFEAEEPSEAEPEPEKKRQAPKYEYVEDESLELLKTQKKRSRRRKRSQLVLDETSGKLVRQRKHRQREDDLGEWQKEDY